MATVTCEKFIVLEYTEFNENDVLSKIVFRNFIGARVSFDMQPRLLCAGLVASYLSKY